MTKTDLSRYNLTHSLYESLNVRETGLREKRELNQSGEIDKSWTPQNIQQGLITTPCLPCENF